MGCLLVDQLKNQRRRKMDLDQIEKLQKERRRSKIILGVIVCLIIIVEVLGWFFDK